jgi:site-specific DNA-methyltransferase (adenine-specific)
MITERAKIELLNCDCMEYIKTLPDNAFDLIITDPPYGINFVSNHRSVKYKPIENDDVFPLWIFDELFRITKRGLYVFCRWDNLPYLPKPKSFLCWVKNNWSMGDLKHEHGRQWEGCAFYPQDEHIFMKRIPDVIQIKRTGNNLHPTEKPVCLIRILIDANICESVFDPFMGSGTTGVACWDCSINFVGCEIDKDYYDAAVKRLENHKKQGQLF